MKLKVHSGKKARARRVLVYGENGVGKSSLAAAFPKPLFLNIEDGIGDIDADSTDIIRSTTQLKSILMVLGDTDYETIVVDTIDWLERIICEEVAKKAGKDAIEEIGFGRGYQSVEVQWKEILAAFAWLWEQGRHIVFTCHETIDKISPPEGDSYNCWRPSLHPKGSGCITEWCDEVLFMRYRTHTIQKEEGFGQKRSVGIGGKERYICATKSAAYEAKNRLGLPDEIPPSFDAIASYLPPVKLQKPKNAAAVGVQVEVESNELSDVYSKLGV